MRKKITIFLGLLMLFSTISFASSSYLKSVGFNDNSIYLEWYKLDDADNYDIVFLDKNNQEITKKNVKIKDFENPLMSNKTVLSGNESSVKLIAKNGELILNTDSFKIQKFYNNIINNKDIIVGINNNNIILTNEVTFESFKLEIYDYSNALLYSKELTLKDTSFDYDLNNNRTYKFLIKGLNIDNGYMYSDIYTIKTETETESNILLNKKFNDSNIVYDLSRFDIFLVEVKYKDSQGSVLDIKQFGLTNNDLVIDNIKGSSILEFKIEMNNGRIYKEFDTVKKDDYKVDIVREPFIFNVDYPKTSVVEESSIFVPISINKSSKVDIVLNSKILYNELTNSKLKDINIPLTKGDNEIIVRGYDEHGNDSVYKIFIIYITKEEVKLLKDKDTKLEIQFDKDYEAVEYNYNKVVISGHLIGGTSISVNGNELELRENGKFEFVYRFDEGKNTLTFEANGGELKSLTDKMFLFYNPNVEVIDVNSVKVFEVETKRIPEGFKYEEKDDLIIDNTEPFVPEEVKPNNLYLFVAIASFLILIILTFLHIKKE